MKAATQDFLVEIGTEELPAKLLPNISNVFLHKMEHQLKEAQIPYNNVKGFATPRRLAVLVESLSEIPEEQWVEKRGPALDRAFDGDGNPTPAAEGFARGCGVSVNELDEKNIAGTDYLFFKQKLAPRKTIDLLPELVKSALDLLPMGRVMRWGSHKHAFLRPIRWLVMLYGKETVPAELFGLKAGNQTKGHPFYCTAPITINEPSNYESLLEKEGYVIPSFEKRKQRIWEKTQEVSSQKGQVNPDEKLLLEVTGLVEWPTILMGRFSERFLEVPDDALIVAMKSHQKYFPIVDNVGKLQPYFILVSNLECKDDQRVVSGNERVLSARLSDADFFYQQDCKTPFLERLSKLDKIIFQKKLGDLLQKVERMEVLSAWIADHVSINKEEAILATQLSKLDLTTEMVNEFTELQGIMGYHYAKQFNYQEPIAEAVRTHYQPRFSGDDIPESAVGCIVALSDKIDTLVGIFGIGQAPTGEKDPFALRRAAMGVLRILIEKPFALSLRDLVEESIRIYEDKIETAGLSDQIMTFMMERLKAWYLEKSVTPQVFSSVAQRKPAVESPFDFDQRIQAVQFFQTLPEAEALSRMNKRVSHLVEKQVAELGSGWDAALFELPEEKALAESMTEKQKEIEPLRLNQKYKETLKVLSGLERDIDHFFEKVMVMAEDPKVRKNRLELLHQLREMFLIVADVSKLQN